MSHMMQHHMSHCPPEAATRGTHLLHTPSFALSSTAPPYLTSSTTASPTPFRFKKCASKAWFSINTCPLAKPTPPQEASACSGVALRAKRVRETQRFFPCNSPVVVRCSRLGLGLQQRGYNRVEATGGRQVQRCACSKCHTNTLVQASLRQLYSNLQPRSSRALTLESGRRARTKGRLPEEGFGGWGLGVGVWGLGCRV